MAEAHNPQQQRRRTPSILSTLGEEIVRIIAPVSACMLLVVVLVTTLSTTSDPSSFPSTISSIAAIIDGSSDSSSSDSTWDKIKDALLYSLIFVIATTAATFLIFSLFYFRCTRFLKSYMVFSSFVVLAFLGGDVALLLLDHFGFPLDSFTFVVLLLNFSVVGAAAVLLKGVPIVVTQGYLVVIGVLVAYWLTFLPEWTSWALLVTMALYDIAAVLLPGGPLRLLVELAISRDEELPALVYEARPVEAVEERNAVRRLWRERRELGSDPNPSSTPTTSNLGTLLASEETRLDVAEGDHPGNPSSSSSEMTAPLVNRQWVRSEEDCHEGIGLGSSGAIKLGLGDFIFYSVLVGRAAMYDFMTVYACYLAIMAGLGITLFLLAFYQKALPALPMSIALGVLFYFLTRFLLEAFVVQFSINLVMF